MNYVKSFDWTNHFRLQQVWKKMEKKKEKITFFFPVEFDASEYKRNKLNNGKLGDNKQD